MQDSSSCRVGNTNTSNANLVYYSPMNMIEVIIGENGEIIIPDKMRRNLDLFPGKKIFLYEQDDSIHIIPSERKTSSKSCKGFPHLNPII